MTRGPVGAALIRLAALGGGAYGCPMSSYASLRTTSRLSADRALCAALRRVPAMSLFGNEQIDGEKPTAVEPPLI